MRRFALAGVGLGLAALVGCGSGVKATSTVTTPPVVTPVPVPTGTKTPIHGLVSMGQISFATNAALTPDNGMEDANANPNVYTAGVVNVTWKQLQAASGAAVDTTAIEAGLAAIATYNASHPAHTMTAKLRVFAGVNAPTWAMNLDGPPVMNSTGTIPRFWTANYQAAWKTLQAQLAAKYDTDARIQEVAVSGCSSMSDEPFIAPLNATTIPVLQAAGFSDSAYQGCLLNMQTMYSAWTVTPLDYTVNQFENTDTGHVVDNPAFTLQVMMGWRASYGTARGVLANHGLQTPLAAAALPVYAEFTALGPPIAFQTISQTVPWDQTIALGLTYHPTEIEIWQTTQAGGLAVISLAQLQAYAVDLQ